MDIRYILVTILLAAFIYRGVNLLRNYYAARKLGLPIFFSPVSWLDGWWPLLAPVLQPFKFLPGCSWIGYSSFGWMIEDRYKTHNRLGPAFVLVTPHKNDIFLSDPEACMEILTTWRVWTKPQEIFRMFEIFGKNTLSTNGDEWQRHRKLMAYGFKESIVRRAWDEAIRQSEGLSADWGSKKKILLSKVIYDFSVLALNVVSATGFGTRNDFDSTSFRAPDPGHQLSYYESLRTILENIMVTILFDSLVAPSWLLPALLRKLKLATKEFRSYTQETIDKEREQLKAGADERANLSAIFVRANEKEKEVKNANVRGVLSDSELLGNIFLVAMAGHETTAGAFSYSLPMLAACPETQDWVIEEVDSCFANDKDYSRVYPRLVRCQAVMYETLRLWGSVVATKTNAEPRMLKIAGTEYLIPADTFLHINFPCLHTNPAQWGSDSLQWKPQRWIGRDADGRETLIGAPDGALYIAWSAGPRVCPGKKFSQVEFAAGLATILQSWKVKPVAKAGESPAQAGERLVGVVENSKFSLFTKIANPKAAALILERR